MNYYFDSYGWLRGYAIPGRVTTVEPPTEVPDGFLPNWDGATWRVLPYEEPPFTFPMGFIDRTDFMGWCADTGMRAKIEDYAQSPDHPLRSIALTLRDVLVGGADALDFQGSRREKNLLALAAFQLDAPDLQSLAALVRLRRPRR